MMTSKKWTISFLLLSVITLVLFAVIMRFTDPLIQYGTENGLFSYYEYSEMYSNPGIAKNYDYDSVLVGTSMIQNTDVVECNELLNCNMVRLPYSGGTCYNMKTILDVCFESPNTIETVYWELDEFQLFSAHNEPRYPLPTYLYRDAFLNDLSYLLNLDIFYHYNLNNVLGSLRGEQQMVARQGETFSGDFSKEAMLKTYIRSESISESVDVNHYIKNVEDNLTNNIIPLIEANPETEFVFFFVPFSILYWDNQIRKGTLEVSVYGVEYAIAQLLVYNNVNIYFYHDDWDIVTNLDNYKDYTHYGNWINSYITEALAVKKDLLTLENYEQVLDEMMVYLLEYDYEHLFS